MFAALVLSVALAAGEGECRVPAGPPVQALMTMVEVETSGGEHVGWGTPVSGSTILTAAHVGDHPGPSKWINSATGTTGPIVASTHAKDRHIDAATLSTGVDQTFERFLRPAKRTLEIGDTLYWRMYLYDRTPTWTRGYYLGRMKNGAVQVDGTIEPGASGSGVLNEAGDLVGLVVGGWSAGGAPDGPRELQEVLGSLLRGMFFRPLANIVPLDQAQ